MSTRRTTAWKSMMSAPSSPATTPVSALPASRTGSAGPPPSRQLPLTRTCGSLLLTRPPKSRLENKMSTPIGDHAFLHELELNISTELMLAETSQPEEEAVRVPVDEWLFDPADAQRYEVGLHNLLGAVEALEDGSGRHRRTETEGW